MDGDPSYECLYRESPFELKTGSTLIPQQFLQPSWSRFNALIVMGMLN